MGNPALSILKSWGNLGLIWVALGYPEPRTSWKNAAISSWLPHGHGIRDISNPLPALWHIPCTALTPADGPSRPGQSVLNQCHQKEFDVLALIEQVITGEKPAILVARRSHFKLLDSRH